jgi:hypothetical protein
VLQTHFEVIFVGVVFILLGQIKDGDDVAMDHHEVSVETHDVRVQLKVLSQTSVFTFFDLPCLIFDLTSRRSN